MAKHAFTRKTLHTMSLSRSQDLVSRYTMPQKEAITKAITVIGISRLKEQQEQALLCFLSGNDTFVSLPTGYGKSIIYAILPLVFDLLLGMYSHPIASTAGSYMLACYPYRALLIITN